MRYFVGGYVEKHGPEYSLVLSGRDGVTEVVRGFDLEDDAMELAEKLIEEVA